MTRWGIVAALCLWAGCARGRCYQNFDCPAPQVCGANGTCFTQNSPDAIDASPAPDAASRADASSTLDAQPNLDGLATLDAGVVDTNVGGIDAAVDTTQGCSPLMARIGDFCIDIYEASRVDATASSAGRDPTRACVVEGVLPWLVGDNAEAALACEAAGKRLCSPDEWQMACEGPDATTYAYGDKYSATTCNGIDTFANYNFHLAPTGSFPSCTNGWGVFDMNGNVWEHVAGGTDLTVRGGAYNCSDSVTYHRCDYIPTNWNPSAKGFRCCTDGNAP